MTDPSISPARPRHRRTLHLACDRRRSASTTHFDKLREECGVMAIYGHPDAARHDLLGPLRAAASRAGVRRHRHLRRPTTLSDIKGMGLVAEIFTDDVLARAARRTRHRPHPLLHHRRLRAAQRPAHLGRVHQGPHRHRAQRQPGQPRQPPRQASSATAPSSRPPPTPRSSSSSSRTPSRPRWSTASPTRSPRSKAPSPSS